MEKIINQTAEDYKEFNDKCENPLYKIIQPFLIRFDYHKLLMQNHPEIKFIRNTKGDFSFWNAWYAPDVGTLYRAPPPQLGDLATLTYHEKNDDSKAYPVVANGKIHKWYDKTLLKILKKLNLSVRRTTIESWRTDDKYGKAYGWEITTSPEELRARGIICF